MKILICHERFLFRFGADRVLILLGRGLQKRGHIVTVMGNRFDKDVVESFASRIIEVPADDAPYLELNEFTTEWLKKRWHTLFDSQTMPDAVVVGGWPFISAISFFREVCPKVVFIDFGVVPDQGYSEGMVVTLNKLRALRREHLRHANAITPLSRFLAETQSRADSYSNALVRPILLGADHMEQAVWSGDRSLQMAGKPLNTVRDLRLAGRKLLLCLGRWEPGCYKNSDAAFEFMEQVVLEHPTSTLIVLDQPSNVQVPAQLHGKIVPIGFPTDRELVEIMKQVDLGISFSLWEGFNLPLAEVQWLGRPVLAFRAGAHQEVAVHDWYLCSDIHEMARKACEVLVGGGPERAEMLAALERFHATFQWERVLDEYTDVLESDGCEHSAAQAVVRPMLIVDVTSSAIDPANSGVIRVTRRLSRALQDSGCDPVFVVWDELTGRYVLPSQSEYEILGRYNGPILRAGDRVSSDAKARTSLDAYLQTRGSQRTGSAYLLLPEVMMEQRFRPIRQFARERNFRIAVVFYDSIPVLRPDLCSEPIRNNHKLYMTGIAECDLAVPISNFSADCLRGFWRQNRVNTKCQIIPNVLPGEFGGSRRRHRSDPSSDTRVEILCVSTLEPRKNHRNLIQACLWLTEKHPTLDWRLTLVGNKYDGAFEIADWIQDVSAREPRIKWLGIIDDATLNELYQNCSFTVYPSFLEGFGLPIVESIWHGKPCICNCQGVMAELAEDGACLTTDVMDPMALGETIYRLATDDELMRRLSNEAITRPLKTWAQYASELLEALDKEESSFSQKQKASSILAGETAELIWQRALYPDCLHEKWQMNDSERMSLTGLLARHMPTCSIEIGTYCGGSLSLVSQFSKMVFSIDIDDTIPSRFSFPNVSFLTGSSTVLLPELLKELDRAGIPVDLVLIDGDHSAEGVMADIACVTGYVPQKPMFVALHDSFNPECRKGILAAHWERSPYCHWVEVDFVPGRITEHSGPSRGEMWGGLALALFLPIKRTGDLGIRCTAQGMFDALTQARQYVAVSNR